MKKTRLLSLIIGASALGMAMPCTFTSCSDPKGPKIATKEQFLKKYEEFLAKFKEKGYYPYTGAAFSSSDMFRGELIDNIAVEQTAGDKCALKITLRQGGTEPYEMNCAGMDLTEINYMLDCFDTNCKDYSPVWSYSVSDDNISMSIQVTEPQEYGETRIYKACELVINSEGYITRYVNNPPTAVTIVGYKGILHLIYYPY